MVALFRTNAHLIVFGALQGPSTEQFRAEWQAGTSLSLRSTVPTASVEDEVL